MHHPQKHGNFSQRPVIYMRGSKELVFGVMLPYIRVYSTRLLPRFRVVCSKTDCVHIFLAKNKKKVRKKWMGYEDFLYLTG